VTFVLASRLSLAVVALAGAATLVGCSSAPPPPPPPPPPAPPPPAAELSLAPAIIQAAAAYQAYMARTAAIKPDFQNGDDVAGALRAGESYDPKLLLRGEIAYAAVAALQDPAFVAELRSYSIDSAGRQQMIKTLEGDSNFVNAFKNAGSAAGLAERALLTQGQDLDAAGKAMKQEAYDMQHQAWSIAFVENRDARLAEAKTLSTDTPSASIDEADRMRRAAEGAEPLAFNGPAVAAAPYPSVVVRGLNIAALALLGAAGDDQASQLEHLFDDKRDEACLSMSKLNLYQCLAGAKPHYEDVFCLGQHVMMDTAQCVRVAAGEAAPSFEPLPVSATETPYAAKARGKKKVKTKA